MRCQAPIRIELSDAERCELALTARSHYIAHRNVVRANVILRLAEGHTVSAIGREVGLERRIVRICEGLDDLIKHVRVFDEAHGAGGLGRPDGLPELPARIEGPGG